MATRFFFTVDQPACAKLSNAGQVTAVCGLPALPIVIKDVESFRFEFLILFVWDYKEIEAYRSLETGHYYFLIRYLSGY